MLKEKELQQKFKKIETQEQELELKQLQVQKGLKRVDEKQID